MFRTQYIRAALAVDAGVTEYSVLDSHLYTWHQKATFGYDGTHLMSGPAMRAV